MNFSTTNRSKWETKANIFCLGEEDIAAFNKEHYEQEGLVQFVIDSVYALAHAIHNLLAARCRGKLSECLSLGYLNGEKVLHYIRNVSFKGMYADIGTITNNSKHNSHD